MSIIGRDFVLSNPRYLLEGTVFMCVSIELSADYSVNPKLFLISNLCRFIKFNFTARDFTATMDHRRSDIERGESASGAGGPVQS